ncbi:phospholipid scramblase 1-like [Cloeon dipterum]|uniref:phospholipid scramblase 1-like n=1 Tax=Cloeon dipterum TaxID=197152 RepID=UPI00321FBE9C
MDQVIIQQPTANKDGAENWMQAPQGQSNCPLGLEYLSMIDQLLVHQKVELLEVLTGFETANKYLVKNSMGQNIYSAKESSNCCVRNCCGSFRPFNMKIYDNVGNMVIHLHRPYACQSCCFPCCLQTMEVTAPPGTLIGTVEQNWSIWKPHFSIKDAAGEVVLKIEGPCCTCSCGGDVNFKVLSADGKSEMGMISKQWSGFVREAFTDADIFGISFPIGLDVKTKAVLLGACFLIDFMFYESKANNNHSSGLGMI